MHGIPASDGDRRIDWGQTSVDYAAWRPDYPPEFYDRLAGQGIGRPGQRVLDLGTGVGFLALNFARRGAIVSGVDIAAGQIRVARESAEREELSVDFRVAAAEETSLPDHAFDAITASQCWLYFDRERAIAEVCRLLAPQGVLMICHFCWLPREDAIARASEQLVLQFNPQWTGADWSGVIPEMPAWAVGRFEKVGGFVFDTPVRFTRERWRGRMRACRGVGAALPVDEVEAYDRAHAALLERIAPEEFDIVHRVDCFVLRPLDP
ncbi:MAG: class I SAM-dependent methyltransferase [Planctomycetaceae bacterium]|nr:class I SAM-dependent methyltransferase [Planctomycetaceae bacterium]